jgi:hypothetical protein
MAKIFYTERDVDDLKGRGVTSIDLNDNIVMTDLALERALKYEMKINRAERVAAPQASFSPSVNLAASNVHAVVQKSDDELKQKIKSLVLAKLDGQVDVALLDTVITRVLAGMK